ncbi:PAS domain S-box protein [Maribellus maritimus]|uniref:PAS domain S-box protein n=1 Tax=Maribellus maritimus TaxID=2870838 RepID=UPI001EEAA0FC|nr:PAS domain S-box protein [Maribellus maritimus]MCG6187938.1 PAS domain S-box protein [Maribellus maritimus]
MGIHNRQKEYIHYQTFNIIIIEHDKSLNNKINHYLTNEGFQTVVTFSGQEALSEIQGKDKEILLLDFNLPDFSAELLIEKLEKTHKKTPNLIMLAAKNSEKKIVSMLRLGAHDYVVKNSSFLPILVEKLKRICRATENQIKLKQTAKALQESKSKFQHLNETLTQGVIYQDKTGKIISANPAAQKIFGISEEKMKSANLRDIDWKVVDEDKNALLEKDFPSAVVFRTGEKVENVLIGINKPTENNYIWTIISSVPRFSKNNKKIIGVCSTFLEVTKRIVAEEKLQKQSSLLNKTADIAKIGGWEVYLDTSIIEWTETTRKIHEVSDDYVPTVNEALDFFEPESRETIKNAAKNAIEHGKMYNLELLMKTAKGNLRWTNSIGIPQMKNNKCVRFYGILQDITDRKLAEEKQRELDRKLNNREKQLETTNQQLKTVIQQLVQKEKELNKSKETVEKYLDLAAEIVLSLDIEGKILMINESGEKLLGYEKDELIGENWFSKCVPPKSKEELEKIFEDTLQNNASNNSTFESEIITITGDKKTILWHNTVLTAPSGKITGTLSSGEDISERKKHESHILTLNKQFLLSQNIAKLAYWNVDLKTQKAHWSDEMFKIYGIPIEEGEITYKEQKKYVHPEDWDLFHNSIQLLIRKNINYDIQVRIIRRDNKIVWTRTKGFLNKKEKEDTIELYGVVQDITEYKETENELIEQKLLFENMFNAIEDAIVITDTERNIGLVNEGVKKTFGLTKDNIIGKNAKLFYANNDIYNDVGLKTFGNKVQNKKYYYITNYKSANNTIFPGETFGTKLFNAKGEWIGNLAIIRNITERVKYIEDLKKAKALAESKEQDFRLLFENMHQGFALHELIYDENGKAISFKFVKVNPAYEKITQRELAKHIGKDIFEIFGKPEKKWISFLDKISKTGKNVQQEYFDKSINKYYLINAFSPRPGFVAVLLADITSVKLYENELIKAKEKAEGADRLKSAFLANMSHEIRTPMNGILGFTSLLNEPGLTGEEKQRFIDIILQSGNRMLNTINDLIDISKIETGQVELFLKNVNLKEEVENQYNFFTTEANKKGLTLLLKDKLSEKEKYFETDLSKISSIIINVVKNAIKYTDRGFIEIGLEKRNHNLIFYVKDTGIGIPEERQSAIFDRFVQADIGDSRAFEGSGLGLSITKAYVEMLGGEIHVHSKIGVGTLFTIVLPEISKKQKKKEKKPDKTSANIKERLKKLNILIAEDDETSFLHLSLLLKNYAKQVHRAKTGLEAVNLFKKNSDIDLILMDIKMPDMDGFEAIKRIREINSDIVIIAQTAYALEGDRAKTLETGCNSYISKPIDKDKLISLIKKHF